MERPATSEIHNNIGWAYIQLKQDKKARDEFKRARALDPMNVKAVRNLRAIGKVEEISKTQICLAAVLSGSLIASFYLFWIERLSEAVFSAQSIIFIALLIFIIFQHQMARFKAGPIEFEKSTEHRTQPVEAISKIER